MAGSGGGFVWTGTGSGPFAADDAVGAVDACVDFDATCVETCVVHVVGIVDCAADGILS